MRKPNDYNKMTDEEKIGYKSAIDDIIEELELLRKRL
jgi:hypothetical protein